MRLVTVAFSGVLALSAIASARAESINEALAAAYNNNPTLNAQRSATRSNDENLPQAKAGFRPQIAATANASLQRSIVNTAAGNVRSDLVPFGYGIQISQNLFNGFRTINTVEAARSGVFASRETLRNVEQNVLLSSAQAYVNVLQTFELIDIRQRNIEFLEEQLRSSRARLDVGEGTRTDVAQSQARLALAQAQWSAARAAHVAAKGVYRQLTGLNAGRLTWPRGPIRLYPSSLEAGMKVAWSEHPAIRATQHLVDVAVFNTKTAEGAFLPTLGLTASATKDYNFSDSIDSRSNLQAQLSLSVPLYQAGGASSAVRQSKELESQRRIEVDQSRDQIRSQLVTAWTELQSANVNLRANAEQVKASKLALAGVIEERNVGQRTQLEVLDAQSQLLQAEELVLNSRASQVSAGYSLVAAIGRLDSRRLGLNVAHYKPVKHFDSVKDKWFGLRTPDGR